MDEYPSNSIHREENTQEKRVSAPVVTGGVRQKKKGALQKFTDTLIQEDAKDIKSYIFTDILIPAFKRFLSDSLDAVLYPGGGGKRSSQAPASRISYRSYYDDRDRRDRAPVRSSNRAFDFDNYTIENRRDADEVLMRMDEILDQYHVVSVADFYDLLGVDNYSYTNNSFGWMDLRQARVSPVRGGGFVIDLPRPLPID